MSGNPASRARRAPVSEAHALAIERILVATGEEAERVGPERIRMGAIAARANISRASLYRAFASKDELIQAWTVHELEAVFAAADMAAEEAQGDAAERFAAGFAAAVCALRAHPVFRSLVLINDQQLIRSTLESSSVLERASELIGRRLGEEAEDAGRSGAALATDSELIARLAISLIVAPSGVVRTNDEAGLREFARGHLAELALGQRSVSSPT